MPPDLVVFGGVCAGWVFCGQVGGISCGIRFCVGWYDMVSGCYYFGGLSYELVVLGVL